MDRPHTLTLPKHPEGATNLPQSASFNAQLPQYEKQGAVSKWVLKFSKAMHYGSFTLAM